MCVDVMLSSELRFGSTCVCVHWFITDECSLWLVRAVRRRRRSERGVVCAWNVRPSERTLREEDDEQKRLHTAVPRADPHSLPSAPDRAQATCTCSAVTHSRHFSGCYEISLPVSTPALWEGARSRQEWWVQAPRLHRCCSPARSRRMPSTPRRRAFMRSPAHGHRVPSDAPGTTPQSTLDWGL